MSAVPRPWSDHLPRGVPAEVSALTAAGTLPAAWSALAGADPDRAVLHDGGWVTRGQLAAASAGVAGRLAAAGLRPGDRVLLSGPNSLSLVVAHVACLRSGFVVVPANGAYRRPEVEHLLGDAAPRAALVDDPAWRSWIRSSDPECLVAATDLAATPADEAVPPPGPPPALDVAAPGDPAVIGYTSGTTGRPKGAVLSHENLLAGAEAVRLAWRWTDADRLVLCLPLFHMHGLGVGLHGTLLAGGSAVLQDGFRPDAVLDAVVAHDATLFFGVPTMYHRLVDAARVGELRRLRLCVAGSAPLAADLHARLAEAAGVRVLERYGMTETVMLVSNPYAGERRAGSVGFPLPGVELRLAGADAPGETGEVEVRGPSVFAGYHGRAEETAAAFTADGWFRTGDLGVLDPDGYVRLVGRSKELIISGGFNVYPREVEDVLGRHPAVAEVAVVGSPSAEWGEEVTACVVVRPGAAPPDVEELRSFARGDLSAFKLPRRVAVVESLPRNALGKVLRHELSVTVRP
jgi:malonyl-CoA/methylmalonyl-CoA synthetase